MKAFATFTRVHGPRSFSFALELTAPDLLEAAGQANCFMLGFACAAGGPDLLMNSVSEKRPKAALTPVFTLPDWKALVAFVQRSSKDPVE